MRTLVQRRLAVMKAVQANPQIGRAALARELGEHKATITADIHRACRLIDAGLADNWVAWAEAHQDHHCECAWRGERK